MSAKARPQPKPKAKAKALVSKKPFKKAVKGVSKKAVKKTVSKCVSKKSVKTSMCNWKQLDDKVLPRFAVAHAPSKYSVKVETHNYKLQKTKKLNLKVV